MALLLRNLFRYIILLTALEEIHILLKEMEELATSTNLKRVLLILKKMIIWGMDFLLPRWTTRRLTKFQAWRITTIGHQKKLSITICPFLKHRKRVLIDYLQVQDKTFQKLMLDFLEIKNYLQLTIFSLSWLQKIL